MKPTKAMITANKVATLNRYGFNTAESFELFAIERRLNSWFTRECNGEIDRDEKSNKVYGVFECHRRGPTRTRLPIRDLETAALRKLDAIMATRPHLVSYVQTDPRGAALYIIEKERLTPTLSIDCQYSRGYCVYNR
jgi:hypothetical protein